MKDTYLSTLLRMRILVGFLGERAQFAWWPTAFFEASGRLFLEPVFSKTSRLAQYHGVLEAARRVHDEHLNVGTYHLFRLPEEIEQDLHALVQNGCDDLAMQAPQDRESALEALVRHTVSGPAHSEGPMAVGRIGDIDSEDVLDTIAAAYVSAFTQSTRTYPYLVL